MHKTGNIRLMTRMSLSAKPLAPHMLLAVFLGVAGFLCMIYTPYFSALLISHIATQVVGFPVGAFSAIMLVLAFLRGILHYGEQACNHYIALKLLVILRDRVLTALRRLAPAWLEGWDKGNLIYLITSGIEALGVLYIRTIPPVSIVVVTPGVLLTQFAKMYILLFMIASLGYLFCGVLLPLIITELGTQEGCQSREGFGGLSNYILESLRRMRDVLQCRIGSQRIEEIWRKNEELHNTAKRLKLHEGISPIPGGTVATLFVLPMLPGGCLLYLQGTVSFTMALMNVVLMVSSFGPVLALVDLSDNLLTTITSARCVLQLLDEKEEVEETSGKKQAVSRDIKMESLGFSYEKEEALRSVQATFKKGKITEVHGRSGSGKSTLLKPIMRLRNTSQSSISVHDVDLKDINTSDLRNMQSPVTQEMILFHGTILNNIRIAKLDASVGETKETYRKAGVREFIMSLPENYTTPAAESGDSLSGEERQRIGLARTPLHDCDCILLDEPTSNLDVLNEAVILKSIRAQKDKTILLISYRSTTMRTADTVLSMGSGRTS